MGTEIARQDIAAPTPEIAASLSPQDLREHRAGIASEVKVILFAYYQPNETDEIKAAQLAWWCDELQDWTREQVVYALRQWNRDFPDKRPTPGHIVRMLKRLRGEREAQRRRAAEMQSSQPPEREPLSQAERTEQHRRMAEVGNKAVEEMKRKAQGNN